MSKDSRSGLGWSLSLFDMHGQEVIISPFMTSMGLVIKLLPRRFSGSTKAILHPWFFKSENR
jgi:hypothetical protein